MSTVNSPKVKYAPDGRPPERKNWSRSPIRIAIVLTFICGVALGMHVFITGDVFNRVAGTTGAVQGAVVDAQAQPIAGAEITLAAAPQIHVHTHADGTFSLVNVPTGQQYLIVVHNGIGQGYVVTVQPEGVTRLDALQYDTMPAVWD